VRVVLDLNVVLDVLLARDEFLESAEILLAASEGKIEAFIPLHGLTTIYYFLRKEMSDAIARVQLVKLLEAARVFAISEEDVREAIRSPMVDFEDAIVAQTALALSADYILTRDARDFVASRVKAITPREFLDRYLSLV
jgi:predicted nucleic acid-binding protein